MALFGLFRSKAHERRGFELYGQAVRAARQPYFFADLAVPDSNLALERNSGSPHSRQV